MNFNVKKKFGKHQCGVKNQICTNIKEKLMHPVQFVFTVGKKINIR